jgi:hypothetical protein
MKLDFSLLKPSTDRNDCSVRADLTCDPELQRCGHTHRTDTRRLNSGETARARETAGLSICTAVNHDQVIALETEFAYATLQTDGLSGHSHPKLDSCDHSALSSGLSLGHTGHNLICRDAEMDHTLPLTWDLAIRSWILRKCGFQDRAWSGLGVLYRDFCEWCLAYRKPTPSPQQFANALEAEGFLINYQLELCSGLILRADSQFLAVHLAYCQARKKAVRRPLYGWSRTSSRGEVPEPKLEAS